jgi:hypothetical protein
VGVTQSHRTQWQLTGSIRSVGVLSEQQEV